MAAARLLRLALAIGLIALCGAGPGAPSAAASGPYLLPLPSGTHVIVTGGNGGYHTGWEAYAWDFAVFGSSAEFPVVAARGGTVIGLQAGFKTSQHCEDDSCWTLANYVLVDQGDKTSALYMHLAEDSVKVSLGEKVIQGQRLGDADNTGWSTANHLHFQIEATPTQTVIDQARAGKARDGWWFTQSIPATFSDPSVLARNPDGKPTYPGSFPGGYVSSNGGGGTQPVESTPPPRASTRPGGTWIAPADGSSQLGTIHAQAHAKPSQANDPAIDHVDFTVWWPDLGPMSGKWTTACSPKAPTSGDQYDCDISPSTLGAPIGQIWLSFDVYDTAGGFNLSPNGERSVNWSQPDVIVADGWQTYQGDGYVVDYPGAARTESVPSSQSGGIYSATASYYSEGPDADPQLLYMVEHYRFAFPLGLTGLDYTALLKETLSFYSLTSNDASATPKDVTINGRSGLLISLRGNGVTGEFEVLVTGADLYMIITAHKTTDNTLDSQRFFDSFHLR
jgi:murein DD-endopeptidase MepM/ murein hydrolase activator NlpD